MEEMKQFLPDLKGDKREREKVQRMAAFELCCPASIILSSDNR